MDVPAQNHCQSSGWSAAQSLRAFFARPASRSHARDRRLIWLLLAAWIMNLFDLGLTLLAWQQKLLIELNPVAALVIPHGASALIAYKLGTLILGTAILWYCRRHWVIEPAVWAYVLLCVGLSLWWHRLFLEAKPSWVQANAAAELLPDEYRYAHLNSSLRADKAEEDVARIGRTDSPSE